MIVRNNVSSKDYNTFNIDVDFERFIEINSKSDFDFLDIDLSSFSILGGGSNILLTSQVLNPVIHINTKGINVIKDSESYVLVEVAAGEEWHNLVLWAIENDYGGIENLSLIPGKCGAAPMQNIGAYGIEIKDVLLAVKVFDLKNKKHLSFHNHECEFGYRTSNFKTIWKGRFVITDIVLQLTKPGHHKLNTSYGAITDVLQSKHIQSPTIKEVSDTIISIRQSKLPDPKVIGNSGSFFKNPIVSKKVFDDILKENPEMPFYIVNENVKIPAGWLIDRCGWKGKVIGNTGTYKNQALVIVNHGGATGSEVFKLSQDIKSSVKLKFGIDLESEVNIWS